MDIILLLFSNHRKILHQTPNIASLRCNISHPKTCFPGVGRVSWEGVRSCLTILANQKPRCISNSVSTGFKGPEPETCFLAAGLVAILSRNVLMCVYMNEFPGMPASSSGTEGSPCLAPWVASPHGRCSCQLPRGCP